MAIRTSRRVERRNDWDLRKRVDEMTEREKTLALLTDWQTGLPNRRAWDEGKRLPVLASIDLDGLKWINDTHGHAAGDALLVTLSKAFRFALLDAYRVGGDEFTAQFLREADAYSALKEVGQAFREFPFCWVDDQGQPWTGTGARFSFGVGRTVEDAERSLCRVKGFRERLGLRGKRGECPPGLQVVQTVCRLESHLTLERLTVENQSR